VTGDNLDQPFSSIESAIEFMRVLAETILEAQTDLNHEHQLAVSEGQERRARGIALAQFKLKSLTANVHRSRRALNDLRMLRRLILDERATVENLIAAM
jgi:hypothetical protein